MRVCKMCVHTDNKTELRKVILAPFSLVAFVGETCVSGFFGAHFTQQYLQIIVVFDWTGNYFSLHIIARFSLATSCDFDIIKSSNSLDKGWFECLLPRLNLKQTSESI